MEFPDRDELVIIIIRKIMPYGAFCILPEYNNMEAFLHVSEIAPRWIKNIHEFVSEGQQHVGKVYRMDREKNQVDISLKRVNEQEKKNKLELIRSEKRAKKLLILSLEQSKVELSEDDAKNAIEAEFVDVWSAFFEVFEKGESVLDSVDIPKALKEKIVEVAKKNIKAPTVEVGGLINLTCNGFEGVEDIKKVLVIKEKDVKVQYLGAPKYKISLIAPNYKDGEKRLNEIIKKMETVANKHECDFSFELQRS
jgi:translation initiation factor 2 subunit 1